MNWVSCTTDVTPSKLGVQDDKFKSLTVNKEMNFQIKSFLLALVRDGNCDQDTLPKIVLLYC